MDESRAVISGACSWSMARALCACMSHVSVDTLEFTYEELWDVAPVPNPTARRLRAHSDMCVTSVQPAYSVLNRLIAQRAFGTTSVHI